MIINYFNKHDIIDGYIDIVQDATVQQDIKQGAKLIISPYFHIIRQWMDKYTGKLLIYKTNKSYCKCCMRPIMFDACLFCMKMHKLCDGKQIKAKAYVFIVS